MSVVPLHSSVTMKELGRAVYDLMAKSGHRFLKEPRPPRSVSVRRRSTVFVASLNFDGITRKLAIKPILSTANTPDLNRLWQVHNRICSESDFINENTATFLGFDADHCVVIMEHVAGPTLLAILRKALRSSRRDNGCDAYLQQAARVLRAMHQLKAEEVGVECQPRRNSSFVADLEQIWEDPISSRYLPAECRMSQWLFDRLSPSFADRVGEHLSPVDVQPKNILVRNNGVLCFIDTDYTGGNPALGLAQFLVSLDRLGLRHPFRPPTDRLAAWKRCFLTAYFEQAAPWVAEDLVFFYPWALLRIMRQHAHARPWFRRYLIKYYARRLGEFSAALRCKTSESLQITPAELFAAR